MPKWSTNRFTATIFEDPITERKTKSSLSEFGDEFKRSQATPTTRGSYRLIQMITVPSLSFEVHFVVSLLLSSNRLRRLCVDEVQSRLLLAGAALRARSCSEEAAGGERAQRGEAAAGAKSTMIKSTKSQTP
ncbi:hypothetical protein SRHO_G00166840 [Serrasalmus rhombeus]